MQEFAGIPEEDRSCPGCRHDGAKHIMRGACAKTPPTSPDRPPNRLERRIAAKRARGKGTWPVRV